MIQLQHFIVMGLSQSMSFLCTPNGMGVYIGSVDNDIFTYIFFVILMNVRDVKQCWATVTSILKILTYG